VCVTDGQVRGNEAELHTSPIPFVVTGESKQVRTPGPAHPHMVVPSEVRAMSSTADNCFTFPPVAVYCHPPSPTIAAPTTNVDDEAPAKRSVCARLSVPIDGPALRPRRRAADGSLSRSNSHPLHRHRRRPRPTTVDEDVRHQQTEPLVERTEYSHPTRTSS